MSLTQLLTLERPLIIIDLETTGLLAGQDRITEIAFEVHRPDGKIDEWRSLVNPGIAIPTFITELTGISDEDMLRCRKCLRLKDDHDGNDCEKFLEIPSFLQLAAHLAKGFINCDFGGKNVRFDLGFLASEFSRAKVQWSYAGACVLDADALERLADPRHLSNLYKKYTGEDHVNAHTALADVKATTAVIAGQLETHKSLPRSLRALHDLSWPGWVDSEGKIRRDKDGVVRIQFGKHRGTGVRKVDRSYWSWICKSDFSDEFKALAAKMAKGEFPT